MVGYIEAIGLGGGGGGDMPVPHSDFMVKVDMLVKWNAARWERGVHFDPTTQMLFYSQGAQGAGGSGLPIIGGFLGGPGGNGEIQHFKLLRVKRFSHRQRRDDVEKA